MTDLNEKLKLVAEYDGFKEIRTGSDKHYNKGKQIVWKLNYHRIYDWQIPVWQKVFSELMIFRKNLDKNSFNQKVEDIDLITFKYKVAIFKGTPLESFEILVEAITFINNLKQR